MSQFSRKTESSQVKNGQTVKYSSTTTISQSWKSSSSSATTTTSVISTQVGPRPSLPSLTALPSATMNDSILRARRSSVEGSTKTYTPVYPRTTLVGTTANRLLSSYPKSTTSQARTQVPSSYKSGPILRDAQITRSPFSPSATGPVNPSPPIFSKPEVVEKPKVMKSGDDVYYQSFSKSKRLVYILNHLSYDKNYQATRDGSEEDVKQLKKSLGKFNVTIKERHDRKKADLLKMARDQAAKNYRGYDFIIYIIMTHGGGNKTLAARDEMYNLETELIQEMQRNKTWTGVPKVFITQACRGAVQTDASQINYQPPTAPNDTLKLFSTYEGFVSYRTTNGTYFIQELCSQLERYGEDEELMAIMRRVTREVSKRAPTPEQSSTLQKALYLGKLGK